MTAEFEQTKDIVLYLYRTRFLRQHIGIYDRHDVCIALEFLVWLKANHPTVLDFGKSDTETFETIRTWLGLPDTK